MEERLAKKSISGHGLDMTPARTDGQRVNGDWVMDRPLMLPLDEHNQYLIANAHPSD